MFDVKRTVISTRFKGVFVASMVTMTASYILILTDNVVAGQFVGADAVAAMTLISPLHGGFLFLAFLIADGLAMMYSYELGRQDREEADRLFGMGIIVSLIFSVLCLLSLIFGRDAILSMWDISPHLMDLAGDYYDALMWLPPFMFFEIFLYTILIAEGEEKLCTNSAIVTFFVNVGLDFVLCNLMGVYGLGLATVIGRASALPILCLFFMRKNCRITFRRYFNIVKAARGMLYSFCSSIDMLCASIFMVIMPFCIIKYFGEEHIIVATTVINVMSLLISLYYGVVDCLQPMVCQYYAEGSLWSVKKTMRIGMLATNAMSLIVMAAGLIFAPAFPIMFGVEDEAIIEEAAFALRIYLPSIIFFGATLMYANYYIYTERRIWGSALKVLLQLVLPTAGMWIGVLFGLTGFWIGFSASFAAAFALNWVRLKGNLLWIDEKEFDRQLTYDINATFDEVMALTLRADEDLQRMGIDVMKRNLIVMWIEELGLMEVDRSNGEEFQIEISILTGREPKLMIVRDNGAPLSDEVKNNLSFRENFIELMSASLYSRKYLSSGDENRLVIEI